MTKAETEVLDAAARLHAARKQSIVAAMRATDAEKEELKAQAAFKKALENLAVENF